MESSTSPIDLALINILPPELLIEIFAFCAAEESIAPLTLGTVCRTWKKIIDESPRVWKLVILDDSKRSIAASQFQVRLWLSRSAPLKFDVKIHLEQEAGNALSLLAPFLPVLNRWRQLTLTSAYKKSVFLTNIFSDFDSLKELGLSISDNESNHGNSGMTVRLTHLPRDTKSSLPLRFTSLYITNDYQLFIRPSYTVALSLLESCPDLKNLILRGWMDCELSGSQSLPVISLPNLHSMTLHSTIIGRVILSHINAPALSNLYLIDLNADLHGVSSDFYESGDSEDEAHDFSRYPWSDQATGMGLRKLIAHCNPPLKVLNMLYSDMRTKDFNFIFNHLTELEEFRVTISDMSDTVIKLLRPYNRVVRVLDHFPASIELAPVSSTQDVRLPHLRCLELRNCPCISGDAIVETLIQRVDYTDRYTPKHTLEKVIVSECAQLDDQHRDVLARRMGHDRFSSQ
ncbi:hypothetical protein F5878DRAFT_722773 [Lentinula raphanica]|uniref:F-box domain-containing protein n=1 Tax=Lentinula raphanica TaxID=153919 RepID=A0AA38UHS5_9AGAR|nr:hypothetical protein F5878DRAFT_722773 [Lentinula raphanica]